MSGWYGLVELGLVFGLVMGWGVWELRKLRAYKDESDREPPSA